MQEGVPEFRGAIRREFLPQKLKPVLLEDVARPIVALGGHIGAVRICWTENVNANWANLLQYREQIDQEIVKVSGTHLFFSCPTVIVKGMKKDLLGMPALAVWAVQSDQDDLNRLIYALRMSTPNAEVRRVQGATTDNVAKNAFKSLSVILKDHNSPWFMDKLSSVGTPVNNQPLVRCYVMNDDYKRIIEESRMKLGLGGMDVLVV